MSLGRSAEVTAPQATDSLLTGASSGRFAQVCLISLLGECRALCGTAAKVCPHSCQEPLHTNDAHDPREIVGEHVQCHLDGDLRRALHQKVRGAHPHLQRRERMLDRLAPLAHRLWVLIETLLHGFEHVLVLPSLNTPLRSVRAL